MVSRSAELGLDIKWDPDEREEVYEHNRKLWLERLRKNGLSIHDPNSEKLGFLKAVRFEIETMGYGITDVAQEFGVPRGSIWHVVRDEGLSAPGLGEICRFWVDDRNMFTNATKQEYLDKARKLQEQERRRKYLKKKSMRMKRQILAIREFAEDNGRVPTLDELEGLVGRSKSGIARDWGRDKGAAFCSYSRAWDLLYAAAAAGERPRPSDHVKPGMGMDPREEGTLGHRLTTLRLERGMALEDLAEEVGMSRTTLNSHELNHATPQKASLKNYCDYYGVTMDWLLTGITVEEAA